MRSRLFGLVLGGVAAIAAASPAHALICYVIYDRNENVIYQSTYPPVDMSSAGYAQREALRARGEHLTFGDIEQCPTVVFLTGGGGNSELRVDDVVAEGRDPVATQLGQVMTPQPQTIHPDKPFLHALRIMHVGRFRHLPVVEDGRPLGMVSSRDALDDDLYELRTHLAQREDMLE